MDTASPKRLRVGLFTTCLVDSFRPAVGYAAIRLLQDAGCTVEVPEAQHCCGHPAFKSGDEDDLREAACLVISTFADYDHVVAPSTSCVSLLKRYGEVLKSDRNWAAKASSFSGKVHELSDFLVDVLGVKTLSAGIEGNIVFHDSCDAAGAPVRHVQPRALLQSIEGLSLQPLPGPTCCGFGAGACSRPSGQLIEDIREAGAGMLASDDLGCLIGLARRLKRDGSGIEVRHVAEILAGMTQTPPIGVTTRSNRSLERQP